MKMLIGLFIFCCSGVQRSVANKESKSFPPTQQGDFQPHATLKSESKRKRQRLGKDKGVRVCVFGFFLFGYPFFVCVLFVCEVSFSVWSVRVHLSSQKKKHSCLSHLPQQHNPPPHPPQRKTENDGFLPTPECVISDWI